MGGEKMATTDIGVIIYCIGFGILCIATASYIIQVSKSRKNKLKTEESYLYRKHLLNMLIVGKLKHLAKEENVDLKESENEFQNYLKNMKSNEHKQEYIDLDDEIEETIQQKVKQKPKE